VVVSVRVGPWWDAAGTLVGYQWLWRDRTPEHEAATQAAAQEQALREQLAQLTAVTRLQQQLRHPTEAPGAPVDRSGERGCV
jgi:hypothetical protein